MTKSVFFNSGYFQKTLVHLLLYRKSKNEIKEFSEFSILVKFIVGWSGKPDITHCSHKICFPLAQIKFNWQTLYQIAERERTVWQCGPTNVAGCQFWIESATFMRRSLHLLLFPMSFYYLSRADGSMKLRFFVETLLYIKSNNKTQSLN